MFKTTMLALVFGAVMTGRVFAGEQYIDQTGYAVSGYDVVSYFDLPQSPTGEQQTPPLAGSTAITAEHNGAVFAFASQANRDRFVADPAAFVPQYDGHCAYGVTKGGKVPANPTLWRIVDGKLYLNIDNTVVGFWEEDIAANIVQSDSNWPALESRSASNRNIPGFTSPGPVTN